MSDEKIGSLLFAFAWLAGIILATTLIVALA